MDSKTKEILQKFSTQRVDLFNISQAKSILKDDFQEDVNKHNRVFKTNTDDLKSFDKKSSDARAKLIDNQEKELDDLRKQQEQQIEKYVNTLSNEIKESKAEIKVFDKKIQKHKSTLKEFEQELKELGIKPSSSKLYEEVDAAIFLMENDKKRLQKGIDFVENNYEYKSNI